MSRVASRMEPRVLDSSHSFRHSSLCRKGNNPAGALPGAEGMEVDMQGAGPAGPAAQPRQVVQQPPPAQQQRAGGSPEHHRLPPPSPAHHGVHEELPPATPLHEAAY